MHYLLMFRSSFPDGPPAGQPIMIKVGGGYVCDSHLIAYLFFLSSFPVLPLFRHGLRVSSCLLALSSCLRIGICSSARAFAFLLLQNPFQSVLGLRVVLSCVLGYLTRYVLHVNTCPFTVYMVWILHLHSIWPALFSRNLCCGPWYLSWLYVTTWLSLRAYYHDHCPRQRSHLKQPYRLSLLFLSRCSVIMYFLLFPMSIYVL